MLLKIVDLPTAKTLFSSVSTGTGLPAGSIRRHSPVTPISRAIKIPN